MNGEDGGGYVEIEDRMMEEWSGGGIRIEYNKIVGYRGIVIGKVWFEVIGRGDRVNGEGVREVGGEIKGINGGMVIGEDWYVRKIEVMKWRVLGKGWGIDD